METVNSNNGTKPMLKELINFIKKFDINEPSPKAGTKFFNKVLRTIQVFTLFFPFAVIVASVIAGLTSSLLNVQPVDDGFTRISELEEGNYTPVSVNAAVIEFLQLAMLGLIAAPIFEELIFRAPLRFKFKWIGGILGWAISQYLMGVSFYRDFWLSIENNYSFIVNVLVPLLTPVILALVLIILTDFVVFRVKKLQYLEENISQFVKSKRSYFILLSSVLFGIVHITKFILSPSGFVSLSWVGYLALPFLLLPQIISGLEFAFVRLRFGLGFSIFSHFLANFFAILPGAFMVLTKVLPPGDLEKYLETMQFEFSDSKIIVAFLGAFMPAIIVGLILIIVVVGWIYSIWEYVKYKKINY